MESVKLVRPTGINLPDMVDLAYVDKLNPIQFEHFVAEMLKTRGYSQIRVTQASGDFGVDVVASKNGKRYAVQAKRYKGKVPFDAVREAVAGCPIYQCQAAMVVTNNYFTEAAKEYTRKISHSTPCELVDRDTLKRWLDECDLAKTPGLTSRLRLLYSKHPVLITVLLSISLFVIFFLMFSQPLCQMLC